jgi:polyhydroxybutyrate depolymerase
MFKRTFLLLILGLLPFSLQAQLMQGLSEHTLRSNGEERSYLLYVPENVSAEGAALVFSFHGSGGVPQQQINISGFDQLSDLFGFISVFPAGAYTNSVTVRSWNANIDEGVDDVQFTRDIIEDVASKVAIDRKRIYASGFSGGARMSSRLACELSDILAAAAPVDGIQYPDGCILKRHIPILSFHGKADQTNQYVLSENSRPYWRMGVETAIDKWRQANGCSMKNDADRISQEVTYYQWSDCLGAAKIQLYVTENGGHTWPGADDNVDINASELIWKFFSRHSLP